ncbi:UPF0496 protein 4-like [Elaeis guineensis]|uniref:UPF0496 protein 4-like n=1 Tax=Elaeis guineensis var. tenera TaxID=51953 RepID=UPI003C6D1A99
MTTSSSYSFLWRSVLREKKKRAEERIKNPTEAASFGFRLLLRLPPRFILPFGYRFGYESRCFLSLLSSSFSNSGALSGCSALLMDLHVSDKFLWAEAFSDLQGVVNEEIRSQFSSRKVTILKELDAVEKYAERLHALTSCVNGKDETLLQSSWRKEETLLQSNGFKHEEIGTLAKIIDQEKRERLQESVSNLAEGTQRLTDGLDLLSKQVRDFFQIVLTGRDALLSNLRVSNATQESSVD